jgi:hypothetical protein
VMLCAGLLCADYLYEYRQEVDSALYIYELNNLNIT